MIKKLMPEYKDDRDKIIMIAMAICSMFASFVSPLVVILALKQYITTESYEIAKAFLNFELFLALISLISVVPLIGWVAGMFLIPALYIWNVVVVVFAVCAFVKKSEVSVPVPYPFI